MFSVSFAAALGFNLDTAGYLIVLLNAAVVVNLVLPPLMRFTAGRCCIGKTENNIPSGKENGDSKEVEMVELKDPEDQNDQKDLVDPQVRNNPYVPSMFYTHSNLRLLGSKKLQEMAENYVKEAVKLHTFVQNRKVADVHHSRKRLSDMKNELVKALEIHRDSAMKNTQ